MEPAFQEYYKKRFNRTKRAVDMARYIWAYFLIQKMQLFIP
jgi:hypothetical protein